MPAACAAEKLSRSDAIATVCDAKLIKGGTMNLADGTPRGRGGVYVASNATLNIADGVIEGGDSTETAMGAYGIYASDQENEEANRVVITGGEILGGMRAGAGPGGVGRGQSIFVEGGGTVDVYGGKIGDKLTGNVMDVEAGFFGNLTSGNNVATVNIYGGHWKGSTIWLYSYNNAEAYLNIYGDLKKTPDTNANQSQYSVEGHLCDGSSFKQTITVDTVNANPLTVSSDCSGFTAKPTYEDDCGSGKKKSRRL